jgi:hypothetical protein
VLIFSDVHMSGGRQTELQVQYRSQPSARWPTPSKQGHHGRSLKPVARGGGVTCTVQYSTETTRTLLKGAAHTVAEKTVLY